MAHLFFKATGFTSGRDLPALSKVEPLIPNVENKAFGHWIFGGDELSLIDVVNQRSLTLQGGATTQPVYADSSVTIPTIPGNALLSDLNDESSQSLTLCAVVKCSSTVLSILLGNLVPSGSTESSGLGAFASDGKAYLTLRPQAGSAAGGIGSLTPAGNIVQTNNFFIAVSVDKSTKKGIVYAQQSGAELNNEVLYTAASYQSSLNKIAIGNVAYTGAAGSATYSEAIIFNKALNLAEIKAVALRSKERLLSRNVTF